MPKLTQAEENKRQHLASLEYMTWDEWVCLEHLAEKSSDDRVEPPPPFGDIPEL